MEKVLIVDNDEFFKKTLKLFLTNAGYIYLEAFDALSALNIIENQNPDLIISEVDLPGMSGIELLQKAKALNSRNIVILMSTCADITVTTSAMQNGAFDHIDKTAEFERLTSQIKKVLESKRRDSFTQSVILPQSEEEVRKILVGNNPAMKDLYRKIGTVSSHKVSILLQGESGTGKELIARTIHESGITKNMPFVAVNCTVLSETLLESELFGHVKGAFTGAVRDKKGKFELASEGTIFLDEISEISPNLQVKLLRVLQEKEYEKVGGEETIPMHARIITASNKNLKSLVEQGRFRLDLYYRLKVFEIEVPSLRERKDDIPLLTVYFLNKINKELKKNVNRIPYEVMDRLQNYEWPGNIRELENVLTQAVVLAKGDALEMELVSLQKHENEVFNTKNIMLSLAEMERQHIINVLSNVNWNKQRACRVLKISKATLYNKIRGYKIEEFSRNDLINGI